MARISTALARAGSAGSTTGQLRGIATRALGAGLRTASPPPHEASSTVARRRRRDAPALARVPGCPDNARPRGPCCVRHSSSASVAAFTRR
jgi:hypothetical protein